MSAQEIEDGCYISKEEYSNLIARSTALSAIEGWIDCIPNEEYNSDTIQKIVKYIEGMS